MDEKPRRFSRDLTPGVPASEYVVPWTFMIAGTAVGAWATGERTQASLAIGALLLIPGILLAMASVRALGSGKQLVTWGPFRWVRHPYFLAILILLLGTIVAVRSIPALVLFIPAVRLTIERARREEHNLRLRFRDAYDVYAKRVPFLLPLAPPLPPGGMPAAAPAHDPDNLLAALHDEPPAERTEE